MYAKHSIHSCTVKVVFKTIFCIKVNVFALFILISLMITYIQFSVTSKSVFFFFIIHFDRGLVSFSISRLVK